MLVALLNNHRAIRKGRNWHIQNFTGGGGKMNKSKTFLKQCSSTFKMKPDLNSINNIVLLLVFHLLLRFVPTPVKLLIFSN